MSPYSCPHPGSVPGHSQPLILVLLLGVPCSWSRSGSVSDLIPALVSFWPSPGSHPDSGPDPRHPLGLGLLLVLVPVLVLRWSRSGHPLVLVLAVVRVLFLVLTQPMSWFWFQAPPGPIPSPAPCPAPTRTPCAPPAPFTSGPDPSATPTPIPTMAEPSTGRGGGIRGGVHLRAVGGWVGGHSLPGGPPSAPRARGTAPCHAAPRTALTSPLHGRDVTGQRDPPGGG